MSSGVKTGRIKVDDQVEKNQDFPRKRLVSILGRHTRPDYTRRQINLKGHCHQYLDNFEKQKDIF